VLKKSIICMPFILTACGPAIVGGIGTVGFSAVEDRGLSGVTSDQVLRIKLNNVIGEQLPTFDDYELTVYKGRVLITGIAGTPQMKADIVRVVKGTEGVCEVIDGLNIKGQDGFAEYTRDGWMTTKLKATLYSDDNIYAPNYLIRTFDKVIYVFGTASSPIERDKVLGYAKEISGVKRVVNLIDVKK
jgi:osmotically-inducible protein OsmY